MRPEIAFFDIDGTLLDFGAKHVNPLVTEALCQLRRKGCRMFLATGRAPYMLPFSGEIPFDGLMCFNGSLAFDATETIFANPLDAVDIKTVFLNAENLGKPIIVATDKARGYTFINADLKDYLRFSPYACPPFDHTKKQHDAIYQLTVPTRADIGTQLLHGTSRLAVVRWCDRALDIIPKHCGKAGAMREILAHYAINRENVLAFGDGGNDIEMLQYAGIGIAMGNAPDAVKASADYVTAACADAGVWSALVDLGYI